MIHVRMFSGERVALDLVVLGSGSPLTWRLSTAGGFANPTDPRASEIACEGEVPGKQGSMWIAGWALLLAHKSRCDSIGVGGTFERELGEMVGSFLKSLNAQEAEQ